MPVYRHLLLAVDLAADSLQVAQRARALAIALDAELDIVHVIEPVPVVATIPPESVGSQVVTAQAALIEAAQTHIANLAREIGIPETRGHVLTGNIKTEIVRLAAERGVDLIVIGSREQHGLALLIRPTEDVVIHQAPCDVLAVRLHGG
ncbi:MAG TPA: universal stress protein [Steroidobacteraceae bacterium]